MRRRRERGQALVEAALGLLVFVTILVFGIHLAEIGYLSLKVQEAQAAALWDSTGLEMHHLGETVDFSRRSAAIDGAAARTLDSYTDGAGNLAGAGSRLSQVYTRSGPLALECNAMVGGAFRLDLTGAPPIADIFEGGTDWQRQGLRCSARGSVQVIPNRFTVSFAEEGPRGLFNQRHLKNTELAICGIGRGRSACAGELGLLLGDWALTRGAGDKEAEECELQVDAPGLPCENSAYYAMVEKAFDTHGRGFGSGAMDLAGNTLERAPPIDTDAFFMSFRGEDSGFKDSPGTHTGDTGPQFIVSPGGAAYENAEAAKYQTTFGSRRACWLGQPCNAIPPHLP